MRHAWSSIGRRYLNASLLEFYHLRLVVCIAGEVQVEERGEGEKGDDARRSGTPSRSTKRTGRIGVLGMRLSTLVGWPPQALAPGPYAGSRRFS